MRVLHILNTNKYSGAENVAITIINEMKRDNEIIYVSPEGSIRDYLEENNINFEPIKKISIKEIRRVIKKYNPDIIHAHDFTASIISSLVKGKVKLISHIHNNYPWMKKINLRTIIYLISTIRYYKILLVSNSVLEEYVFRKFLKNKAIVIGNPIDISKTIKEAQKGIINENYDLAFLGRLAEQKNPLEFIEIVHELNKKIDISAVMIGTGNKEKDCRDLINKYNLQGIIELKGFLKNPYVVLKNCKILCMTSIFEGYGLVAIEALTLGKPVVATNVGGIPTIVNEKCGKLSNNIEERISEIEKLLTNREYYDRKSEEAIKRANELNNLDSYICNIKNIYEGI